MRYTVVMPWMHKPYRDECLADCRFDNILEIDNSTTNRGCCRSYNLGVDQMRLDDSDWLVILSPAVRFGASGGRDFITELEARPTQAVVSAEGTYGWHLIAFQRHVIEAAGRWDENFFPCYWDDLDYSIRIHKALPDAVWGGVPVDLGDTIWAHSIKLAGLQVPNAKLEAYYADKWGGPPHGSDFPAFNDHPFADESRPIGWWPDCPETGGVWDEPHPELIPDSIIRPA